MLMEVAVGCRFRSVYRPWRRPRRL